MAATATTTTDLIDAARELGPLIREHNQEMDRECRLPEPVADAMREAGFFRMLLPAALGGLEVDPITNLRVIDELSRSEASVGWNVFNAGASAGGIAAFLPADGAEEIFGSDPNVITATSFNPPGQAQVVDGGYRLSGRWAFVSGCRHSEWPGGLVTVMDGETRRETAAAAPELRVMYFPEDDAEILDTWDVGGLRGTGSNDIEVTDVFVPESRTFFFGPGAERNRHYQGSLYQLPFIVPFAVPVGAVAVGTARGAIDAAVELAAGKTPSQGTTTLRERHSFHTQLGQAEAAVGSARAWMLETVREAWEGVPDGQEHFSPAQRGMLLLAGAHATSSAARAVDLMHTAGGGSSVYSASLLQRYFRDIHAVTQHTVAAHGRFESAGRSLLGLPTDFAMLAI